MTDIQIGIIGAGKWATAIAHILSRNNIASIMWTRNEKVVESINKNNENEDYFPDHKLSELISATSNFQELNNCEVIFLVIPTQKVRELITKYDLNPEIPIVICNKGIEIESGKFVSQIVQESWQNETLILSGPNFASEIINDLPAASTLASSNIDIRHKIAKFLNNKFFRIYESEDKLGVEICGAVKNVLAIASGICAGKNLGENARAALITRGLHETGVLIAKLGGNIQTLNTLAGIGDIILTCNSKLSRNMTYGYYLANNKNSNEKTIEGLCTVQAIEAIRQKLLIEMPIAKIVYDIINKKISIDQAIEKILNRPINNCEILDD